MQCTFNQRTTVLRRTVGWLERSGMRSREFEGGYLLIFSLSFKKLLKLVFRSKYFKFRQVHRKIALHWFSKLHLYSNSAYYIVNFFDIFWFILKMQKSWNLILLYFRYFLLKTKQNITQKKSCVIFFYDMFSIKYHLKWNKNEENT